jgi:hypothetical protein
MRYWERLSAGRGRRAHLSAIASPPADDLSALFLPFRGKEFRLPAELVALYNDIDLDQLRIRRPTRFIFFCGGAIAPAGESAKSLRCSLLRDKKIGRRLKAEIVLAEKANQLYRDTDYPDLISFEEDIARIAAMVLVIAESAGSLAELGAFATNDMIRPALSILIQTSYMHLVTIRFLGGFS